MVIAIRAHLLTLPSNARAMPGKTFVVTTTTIGLARLGGRHDGGIIVQRPDQRVLFQQRQRPLFRGAAFQERAERAEPKRPVR